MVDQGPRRTWSSPNNYFYATIVHQMKPKPTKEDAPIKLRRRVAPPLAVGLATATAQKAQSQVVEIQLSLKWFQVGGLGLPILQLIYYGKTETDLCYTGVVVSTNQRNSLPINLLLSCMHVFASVIAQMVIKGSTSSSEVSKWLSGKTKPAMFLSEAQMYLWKQRCPWMVKTQQYYLQWLHLQEEFKSPLLSVPLYYDVNDLISWDLTRRSLNEEM